SLSILVQQVSSAHRRAHKMTFNRACSRASRVGAGLKRQARWLPESVLLRREGFGGRREPTLGRSARRPRGRPALRDPGRPPNIETLRAHFAAMLTLAFGRSRRAGVYWACTTASGRTSNKSAAASLGPAIVLPADNTLRMCEKPSAKTDAFQACAGGHLTPFCVARPNSRPVTTMTPPRSPTRADATISPRLGPTTWSAR